MAVLDPVSLMGSGQREGLGVMCFVGAVRIVYEYINHTFHHHESSMMVGTLHCTAAASNIQIYNKSADTDTVKKCLLTPFRQ